MIARLSGRWQLGLKKRRVENESQQEDDSQHEERLNMILRRTRWGHARLSLRRSDNEREHSRHGNNAGAGGIDGAVNVRACPPGFPKGRPAPRKRQIFRTRMNSGCTIASANSPISSSSCGKNSKRARFNASQPRGPTAQLCRRRSVGEDPARHWRAVSRNWSGDQLLA